MQNLISNTLGNSSFVILNKAVIKALGMHEAVVLGFLVDKWAYFQHNDFYYTIQDLANDTDLSDRECRNIMRKLVDKGILIKRAFEGIPPKQYYNINQNAIIDILKKPMPTKENPTKDSNLADSNPLKNDTLNPCKNDRVKTCKSDRDIYNNNKINNNKGIITNIKATETEKSALSVKTNENAKSHILQSIFSLDLFLHSDNISQADLAYLARYSHLVSSDLKYIRELALFILHRKDIKKPLTERALKSILEKLKGFKEPKQALENSIMNGWCGVFENTKPSSKDDFIAKSHNTFDNGDNILYHRSDGE